MQERIDTINRVLREQITGVRVIRAFVRDGTSEERFDARQHRADRRVAGRRAADGADVPDGHAGAELLQRRRAVVRRAPDRQRRHADRRADRVPDLPDADPDVGDDGHLHVHDGAARRGVRRADQEVLDTESERRARRPRRCRAGAAARPAGAARRRVPLPGRRGAGAARHRPDRPARRDHRDHRRHRQRQDHAAQPGPAAVRRDRRRGAGRRRRRARPRPGAAVGGRSAWCRRSRTCSPARSRRTCGTASPTPPTRSCGSALEIAQARDFVEQMAGRPGRADRAGRHQRLRRPAAAAGHRPGAGAPARRSTCSTTRSPRSTTPPTRRCARRWPRRPPRPTVVIVAQRVSHHPARRPDRRARRRAGSSAPAPTPS